MKMDSFVKKRKLSDNSIILIDNKEDTVSHDKINKDKDNIIKLVKSKSNEIAFCEIKITGIENHSFKRISERNFNYCTMTLTDKRSGLYSEKVNKILFIRSNIDLM
jgi:uncharacterized protein YqfB (UPF0267 family)